MLISVVSLLMNVALYAIILIGIIIGCDYALIAIDWGKTTVLQMIEDARDGIKNISDTLGSVQSKISGITKRFATLDLNPLSGICE
jgi:hypothetical protein